MPRRVFHPLRLAQYRGHTALDALYAPLSDDAEQSVLRWAGVFGGRDERGVLRWPVFANDGERIVFAVVFRGIVGREIGELLARAEPVITQLIVAGAAEAARVGGDPTTPLPQPGSLIVSLRRNRANVVKQVSLVIDRAIRVGDTPAATAQAVARYFSPWYAPRRDATGTVRRADRGR